MAKYIELDGSDKRSWDIRELVNMRSARYRFVLVACVAWSRAYRQLRTIYH